MTLKDRFPADDRSKVLETPMLAGFAITAAHRGALNSAVLERGAIAESKKTPAADRGQGSLAHAVGEAYKTSEGRSAATVGVKSIVKGKRPAEASEAAVRRLAETFAMIERTAPDQAATFRQFLIETATKTAEASTEGGFLGFGGEKISEAEHKTLSDLKVDLGQATV